MAERREKRKRWVQRGKYAVEVEVEVIFPTEAESEACLEPATVRWLDEIARRAESDDLAYLQQVGRVFQAVTNGSRQPAVGQWSNRQWGRRQIVCRSNL